MAYYDALIAAWNNATVSLPSGTAGSLFFVTDTTVQKLAKLDAWTVTGNVPTSFFVTGDQLANCINYTEFKALTAAQQSNLLAMCQIPGQLLGGSANATHLVPGMILDYFSVAGATVAALTALAKGTVQPWWQSAGYQSVLGLGDVVAAGLS